MKCLIFLLVKGIWEILKAICDKVLINQLYEIRVAVAATEATERYQIPIKVKKPKLKHKSFVLVEEMYDV